ncbi:Serine/threonine/tyrosine-interacting-like protein 1 [Phytophthora boehmeriae]|uniref:protein-tyrosine-phosphatase n=1 Tax=Phytophthora boehmeriae TaxID=109152 RepID=A0A8T1XBN3_9STRA|nr:Serine/threonine/tyrosine-interacting-like protein 1 [Phytophthora boehmeriae]
MGETQLVRVAPTPTCVETSECNQRKACKRTIRKRVVESRWLFNNIHVGEVLVDCRSQEQFQANTVIGAINIPPPQEDRSCAEHIEKQGLAGCKRSLRDVVLFADKEDVDDSESWLYQLEAFLIEEAMVMTVKILCDGFSNFQKRYPFYTTLGIVGDGVLQCGKHHVAYPNEIIDNFLFLGNMWQAQSKQVFQDLGITHVVNATLDVGNVFEDDGVKYFNAKLLDKPDANISQFFDAACRFITEASRSTTADGKPCRVFVHCTQGISRSATLVIVYVMRIYHWSLAQAFNFTRSGRGVIVPNEGFLRALLAEERRLFRHKCSVTENELEILVSGCLPSRPARTVSSSPELGALTNSGPSREGQCSLM